MKKIDTAYLSAKEVALADFAKALALPIRVCIVRFILEHKNEVSRDKFGQLPFKITTISQHLSALKYLGVIKSNVKDKTTFYSVNEPLFIKMSNSFLTLFQPIRQLNEEANRLFAAFPVQKKRLPSSKKPIPLFGEYIKEKRKQKQLSQGNLALLISVDRGWISKLENSKVVPKPDKLHPLANALQLSLKEVSDIFYQNQMRNFERDINVQNHDWK